MDGNLIQRCRNGDEQAFVTLFTQYKNLVFKSAYLMLDSRQEAEDALQDVFVQVHRNLNRYDAGKGAFTTWLHRITVNHCLNRRRRQRLWQWFGVDIAAKLRDEKRSPEEGLADEAVRQGLRQLNDKLRSIVILRYYHDLAYSEIANVLEIPIGTVKSRLNQALRELRQQLKADFAELQTMAAPQEVNL